MSRCDNSYCDRERHGRRSCGVGVNRWVLVDAGDRTLQRQVSAPGELAALLVETGLDATGADELALECWRQRPAGADSPSATPGGAVWRATGLSRLSTLLLLLAVAAGFVVFVYYGGR
jgi:hypothetical protein